MMEKDKLRKADIFSGGLIFLFGLWIVTRALGMPMKDSYGGVQNVWYVSPALFPLLVGGMIMLLGALLTRTALKEVGSKAFKEILKWLVSHELLQYLITASVIRFYAMVLLFFGYIYLNIPRIDFFLCSILFLVVFINMFYLDDERLLKKIFFFYLGGTAFFILFFVSGVSEAVKSQLPYAGDWLMMVFILACCFYIRALIGKQAQARKKYRTALILSFATPFIFGVIFKYLLYVPMPTEGVVVVAMDALWYWDF